MKQEKQQEIALMRYGAIAPIIAGLDERYPSKTAFYTEISAKGLMGEGLLMDVGVPLNVLMVVMVVVFMFLKSGRALRETIWEWALRS